MKIAYNIILDMVRKKTGFTLIEVVIAMLVVFVAVIGLLAAYASSFELVETARNTTYALNEAQEKIEELRGHTFTDIYTYYTTPPNDRFDVDGISATDGEGSIEIINDGSDPQGLTSANLLQVTVTVCWSQRSGRIIGEDTDLDGELDAGEDANGNGIMDSPVMLVTYVANR